MGIPAELVAPITVDLRADDNTFNIIKGLEHLNYEDFKMDTPSQTINPGMWVKKTATGCLLADGTTLPLYPVVVGNNEYDSIATGNVTVIIGYGWIYSTTQFSGSSFTIGALLTVDSTSKLEVADDTDPIVAKVYAYDAVKGVLTVEVLPCMQAA